MNRAFLVVGVPAVLASICWLAYMWGWRVAIIVTFTELAALLFGVVRIIRRKNERPSEAGSRGIFR